MSGTIGTTPHRWFASPAVTVLRARARLAAVIGRLRTAGGLPTSVGLPVAVLLTASVVWATVTAAGALVA